MSTIYDSNKLNRLRRPYQGQRFSVADESGIQYYSGADCKIYFDNILVDQIDSIGFQQSQNIRPIYGYQSHVYDALQFGTKLVQGYFQVHFTESGYIPSLLAALEITRRQGGITDKFKRIDEEEKGVGPISGTDAMIGATLESVLSQLVDTTDPHIWRKTMDALDARRFPDMNKDGIYNLPDQLKVNGLFPPKPLHNDFAFNPNNTFLRSSGFTITVAYGEGELQEVNYAGAKSGEKDMTISGSYRRLHEAHIVAGPNTQIEADGKPIAELYTFICRDIS